MTGYCYIDLYIFVYINMNIYIYSYINVFVYKCNVEHTGFINQAKLEGLFGKNHLYCLFLHE